MARMSGAVWQGEHSPRASMSRYDVVCIHTIVGYAPAHAAHFSVRADGTILQSRDTKYRSAANLNGNHRVISIENEDHGSAFPSWSGSNVPDFTDAQIEANAKILAWAHKTHGVPLQLCPNSRSTSRGLGYHRQGIDGNFGGYDYPGRVSGGEVWSSAYGKVCPGDRRISRRQQILNRAKQIVNGDDHMSAEDVKELKQYIDKKVKNVNGNINDVPGQAVNRLLNHVTVYGQLVNDERPTIEQAIGRANKSAYRTEADQAKALVELAAIRKAVGGEVDEAAIAQQVAALVTPAVIAALAGVAYLTPEQVETAAENAVRGVLGELDDPVDGEEA